MAGRKPGMNWTKSRDQWTTTIDGVFHLLGRDKDKADAQFRFLLNKADLGEIVDKNPFFAHIADQWLAFVKKIGGMEFFDVHFSYIDQETLEERFISVPEQGGGTLIPDGPLSPGVMHTVATGTAGTWACTGWKRKSRAATGR